MTGDPANLGGVMDQAVFCRACVGAVFCPPHLEMYWRVARVSGCFEEDLTLGSLPGSVSGMTNQRICQFHLTSTKDAVVEHHPQATSKFAKEQGTIVLRFEEWVSPEARQSIVDAMNAAKIGARDLHGGRVAAWAVSTASVRAQERE